MTDKVRFITAFMFIYLGWGFLYLAIRFALESIPPFLLSGSVTLLSGVTLFTVSRLQRESQEAPKLWIWGAVTGILLICFGNGAVVWGEQFVPSAFAALLLASEPFWIILFDALFFKGKMPSWVVRLSLVIGFIGVALLFQEGLTSGVVTSLSGLLAIFLASIAWAFGSLVSRYKLKTAPAFLSTAIPMLFGGLILLIISIGSGEFATFQWGALTRSSVLAYIYIVCIGTVGAYTSYVWLLKRVALPRVTTYAYVNPLVALLAGWLLAGEKISLQMLCGALLILGAVVFLLSRKENA